MPRAGGPDGIDCRVAQVRNVRRYEYVPSRREPGAYSCAGSPYPNRSLPPAPPTCTSGRRLPRKSPPHRRKWRRTCTPGLRPRVRRSESRHRRCSWPSRRGRCRSSTSPRADRSEKRSTRPRRSGQRFRSAPRSMSTQSRRLAVVEAGSVRSPQTSNRLPGRMPSSHRAQQPLSPSVPRSEAHQAR